MTVCARCSGTVLTRTIEGDLSCLLCGEVAYVAAVPLRRLVALAIAEPLVRRKPAPGKPRVRRSNADLGQWSGNGYTHCLACGTTERKHKARGLCTRCYQACRFEALYKARP